MAEEPAGFYTDKQGRVRPRHNPKGKGNKSGAAMGVAVAIVLSALAGSGVGAVTSVSGTASEYDPRTSRSESGVRTSDISEYLKATTRLRQLGYRVTLQARSDDNNCDAYSDGEVYRFFLTHPCRSLHRTLLEVKDKSNVILLATATIVMPDEQTAVDLRTLLDEAVNGKIIQLTPKIGRYNRFDFTHARFCTTRNGATVISVDAKPVGRTLGAAILDFVLSNALPGC